MPPKKSDSKKTTAKKAAASKTAGKKKGEPDQVNLQRFLDEVKKRAYEIFLERGSAHGNDLDDWLKAEKEIKKKYGLK